MRVMGIDPGLTRLGFGLVEAEKGNLSRGASGTIRTPAGPGDAERLLTLFDRLAQLIEDYRPEEIAIERVFLNLNERTAVPVMRASGVALLAAAKWGAPVYEYSPLEVKQAVAGVGSATKDQVRFMVQRILGLEELPKDADAADALALAITHIHSRKMRALQAG